MAPGIRSSSTMAASRITRSNVSENAFPGKSMVYSKRKADFSPPKTKNTKRPALNDLTNDCKMRKVKSILKKDKLPPVMKEKKCVEVKPSRPAPQRKPAPNKTSKKELKSLRSKEPEPKEVYLPTVVLQRLTVTAEGIIVGTSSKDKEVKPARRSSARLSMKRSLSVDKSECNSLYVSALEEVTNKDTKSEWYELTEFDKELVHDPHQVPQYVAEIFYYLKSRESHFLISDYLARLTDITKDMRSILVDWMVEVQENFELNHETLYLSVKLVDAYLDKITEIRRDKLQLVGVTAMFVACKYDERLSPVIDDFVYVCDGAYEQSDIIAMEQRLLDTIDYELSFPISYSFLRRYARCARVPMPLLTLARYILELSLVDYSTVTLSDSKQAAAALYLAFRMAKHSNWTESLTYYTGYKLEDFKDIVLLFNSILHKKFPEEVKAVWTKYSHELENVSNMSFRQDVQPYNGSGTTIRLRRLKAIFFEVSKTRLISDEDLKRSMAEHT